MRAKLAPSLDRDAATSTDVSKTTLIGGVYATTHWKEQPKTQPFLNRCLVKPSPDGYPWANAALRQKHDRPEVTLASSPPGRSVASPLCLDLHLRGDGGGENDRRQAGQCAYEGGGHPHDDQPGDLPRLRLL